MRYLAELESPHASTSILGSVAPKGHLSEIQAGELSSSWMMDLDWDATISGGGVIKKYQEYVGFNIDLYKMDIAPYWQIGSQ